jgi:hypothetical protein
MRGIPSSKQQRPSLPESEWRRIDARFEEVSSQLNVNVHLILTDRSARELGHQTYVYLEPLGHIVVTLGYAENKAVIWTDPSCWHEGWAAICDDVEKLMREDRLVDALLHVLDAVDKRRSIMRSSSKP